MSKTIWKSKYFCGNEISEYGIQNKRLDYRTLAKSFDAVLCNDIVNVFYDSFYDNIVNGDIYYFEDDNGNIYTYEEKENRIEELTGQLDKLSEDYENDIFDETSEKFNEMRSIEHDIETLQNERYYEFYQYYLINGNGKNILCDYTNETVFYIEKLDIYVWAISHYGTSWDYVLTDVILDIDD